MWGHWLSILIDHATLGSGCTLEDGCEELVCEHSLLPLRDEVWREEMPLGLGRVS